MFINLTSQLLVAISAVVLILITSTQCSNNSQVQPNSFNYQDPLVKLKNAKYRTAASEQLSKLTNGVNDYLLTYGNYPGNIITDVVDKGNSDIKRNVITGKPLKQVAITEWSPGDVCYLYSKEKHGFVILINSFNPNDNDYNQYTKGKYSSQYYSETPDKYIELIDIDNKIYLFNPNNTEGKSIKEK